MANEYKRPAKSPLFGRVTAIIAAFISTLAAILTVTSSVAELPAISVSAITTIASIVAASVTILTALFVVIRYVLAGLSRIKLDKSDVYFAIALLVAIASVLISHYWR